MKLEELQWSAETLQKLNQLILERIGNLGLQIKGGQPPLQIVIGELAVVEAKLDALMHMLEAQHDANYGQFDDFMRKVCDDGIAVALQTRAIMTAPKGPTIVKP